MTDDTEDTDNKAPRSAAQLRGSITKGSIKEAVGKLTGDARMEAEGRARTRGEPPPDAAGTRAR
jgi:uncharacterized protein YjbJ (UPF0337 family)